MNLEKILTAFNDNMQQNAPVLEYISRPNIFDTIGKARNEMSHSKMIAHLLSAYNTPGFRESPIVHLLDIIIKRSIQQSIDFPDELKNAVLTRDLPELQLENCNTEVLLSDLKKSYRGKDRVDIHLLYKLKSTIVKSGRSEIELIIENKVQGREHDIQTDTYYKTLKTGQGKNRYQFFIYLTPVSTRELDDFSNMKDKPACGKFICINYQDILDSIIDPLLAENILSDRERIILNDYVCCLELPALPDTNKEGVQDKFEMSIMATSAHERNLINKFLSVESNRRLIQLVTSSVCGTPTYAYKENMGLTFNEALPLALSDLIEGKTEFGVINATWGVVSKKGETPFLVLSPNGKQYLPGDFYETCGRIYPNLYTAVAHSIMSYANSIGLEPSDIVSDFNAIYGKKKGKALLANDPQEGYEAFDFDFYIRKDVGKNKLRAIFDITQRNIRYVNEEEFHNLVMSDNRRLSEFLQDFNPDLYCRIEGTNFYYRHDTERYLDNINERLKYKIEKLNFSQKDKDLLKRFYDSHLGLILSVHKIKTDNESDTDRYKSQLKTLKKLLTKRR